MDRHEQDTEDEDGPMDAVYLKFIAEGCATLEEVAQALRSEAEWLERAAHAGFRLSEPVSDGHVLIEHTSDSRQRVYRRAEGAPDTFARVDFPPVPAKA